MGSQVEEYEIGWAHDIYVGEGKCIQGFDGEILRKETTWKSRHRWDDNIKMDLTEIEWDSMDWIIVA